VFYTRSMEQVAVRELNQHTSRVLARVREGVVVEVTDRGVPVARLVPVGSRETALGRLVSEGRAVAPVTSGPLPLPPVLGDPAVDVAEKLAEAREEERW
jgi:prevent-host-death family protein